MAGGLIAGGDQKGAPIPDALDLAVQHTQLRRVALVVRRVDGQQRRLDALEARRRVAVARRVPLIELVIRIGA